MPKKYYAVVAGHKPGIYTEWPEVKKNIAGFPNAIQKGFNTKKEAEDYFAKHKKTSDVKFDVIAYTDGSYVYPKGGFGVVMLAGKNVYTASGPVPDIFGNMGSDVAELYAIYIALNMYDNDLKIYTDSQYSINILEKDFRALENVELVDSIKNLLEGRFVAFQYIKAHVGHRYNEMADELAKHGRRSEVIETNYD